jgi:DNA ligase D-like protein (predicted 3'-phosphoesterase)
MPLAKYAKKRDFSKTPEPSGAGEAKVRSAGERLIYVIQKHKATHLHWDLRLQEGEVLASWAIPKEPPAEEGVRRLAVQVEDHPLDYAAFEGTIPEGEYGAGTVEIWDCGTYVSLARAAAKRIFEIRGKRLSGPYCLIKLKPGLAEDRNWLFFKLKKGQP